MSTRYAAHSHESAATVQGAPLWLVSLDRRGRPAGGSDIARTFADLIGERGATDVFFLAHGWNNDSLSATTLYHRLFSECARLLSVHGTRPGAKVGYAGVLWPSVHWPDANDTLPHDASQPGSEGGAARLSGLSASDAVAEPAHTLSTDAIASAALALFTEPDERTEAAGLISLLNSQPDSERALEEFMSGLRRLALDELTEHTSSPAARLPDEDALEGDALFAADWRELLETLADREPPSRQPGGAASAGAFGKLWRGARGAFRLLGYWTMKRRAGIVGQDGLGPLLAEVARHAPDVRVHLVGHSFGARLVSYALKGLGSSAEGAHSPVKSLLLLQGAFSHYSFASRLPHDPQRAGHLNGMTSRVDGPLLATHSRHDTAIRYAYPLVSLVARQDASAIDDPVSRWGAMGDNGAQAVDAGHLALHGEGEPYELERGRWYNLNGDKVIRHGPAPSGAHGDVVHPETAWAALQAAGLTLN